MTEYRAQEKVERDASSKLKVIIVGAGLGGLGAAISVLLAGHDVTVLESASSIGEIGAGIQILPNSARVLFAWGLHDSLQQYATTPETCNFIGWKGNKLSTMNYHKYGKSCDGVFWDFHRVNLHKCLLDRAAELGAKIETNARAVSYTTTLSEDKTHSTATVKLGDGRTFTGDLVVGADGINSQLRETFVGHVDPPTPTGDLAYRLLLDTSVMMNDPQLADMVRNPQVNYWLGPDAHAVNYILRGGKQLNMVLLVPDNMPGTDATTGKGTVYEMRKLYKGWDPVVEKLLALCEEGEVLKWRLCIRPGLDPTWSDNATGAFTLLGDAIHATLPYLASGAGMALEDGGVLGLCLAKLKDTTVKSKQAALAVYEACRRERTEKVVARGTYNQHMYHLHDGPEQVKRDQQIKHFEELDDKWLADPKAVLPKSPETGEDPFPWRYHGVGRWLLTYDMWEDVESKWPTVVKGNL